MARKLSKAASACVSRRIKQHCGKKHGRKTCRNARVRAQAVAIAFSQCRRAGFRSVPSKA